MEANADIDVVTYSEDEVNLMLAEAVAQAELSAREEASDSILNQIQQSLEGNLIHSLHQPVFFIVYFSHAIRFAIRTRFARRGRGPHCNLFFPAGGEGGGF